MVDQTNIFEGGSSIPDQGENKAASFQVPEVVSELVGEGKKYSDINKALESIPHAQTHIQKLEAELAEVRAKLQASTSVEETLKQFKAQQEQGKPTSQPVGLEDIAGLIESKLSEREKQSVASKNQTEVVSKLTEQFGDKGKAEEAFVKKAKELGVSVSHLDDLAKTSPKAIFALFGTGSKPSGKGSYESSVNSQAFSNLPQQRAPVPQVMSSGSSTTQVLDAWRAATAQITGD